MADCRKLLTAFWHSDTLLPLIKSQRDIKMRLSKLTTGLILCLPLVSFQTLSCETLQAKIQYAQYANAGVERGFAIPPKIKPKRGFAIPPAIKPK